MPSSPPGHGQFCSRNCKAASVRNEITVQCKKCGKDFKTEYLRPGKYCSQKCYIRVGERFLELGYWVVRKDGRKIKEHRWVMEQHIGRNLTDEEIVHHRNHDKLDNRVENLQLTTRQEHMTLHKLERLAIKELE